MPDAASFGQAVEPAAPRHRALRQLHELLTAAPGRVEIAEANAYVERLTAWLRSWGGVPRADDAPPEPVQVTRVRLLVRALEQFPEMRARVAGAMRVILERSSALHLLARLGIPGDRGLGAETRDRLSRRFLPEPVDEQDLTQLLGRFLPSEADARWLDKAPIELVTRLVDVLDDPAEPGATWSSLLASLTDALSLLATRISALGLSDELWARSPQGSVKASPFFHLPRAADALIEAHAAAQSDARSDHEALHMARRELDETLSACRQVGFAILENLEERGVSVDVVYRIEVIGKSIERMQILADELDPAERSAAIDSARKLLVQLLGERARDRKLGDITRSSIHLMARKIIERAGHTGEHYITRTAAEYRKMLLSAGGGGVLTCGTAALKFLIGWLHLPMFVEGALSAANYAGSFIVMQLFGMTLATKQPSMTAAALAGSLRQSAGGKDLSGLVKTIARITRSQLAAAIGNVGMVIPACIGFDRAWRHWQGHSFLDADASAYVLKSLHPTESGTIPFAALTGVLLWMSSVGAGWLENWAVYRRLPEAIAEHRIRRWIGNGIPGWASRFFAHNVAGFGGNATLGTLLAVTPILGKFTGLPLDVRHVTLSTGALTLAICSIGPANLGPRDVAWSALGIAIIGMLNFGVSFVLALMVALRAREVAGADRLRLFRQVIVTFFKSPVQFFYPVKSDAADPAELGHGPISIRASRASLHG